MIRTCPRCGDFYADGSLLFCPADGTPLADVSPQGETWAGAARAVEEKSRVLRRQARRLRLRRVLTLTTSVLIATLVVCVVAVNVYVYLVPQPDEPVVADALTPTPTPRRSDTPTPTPAITPTPDTASQPFVPAVTPTPTPEATPTPDRRKHPTDGATPVDTSTPTPTPVTDATPTPTPTPPIRDKTPTPTPTPTPDRRHDLIAPPSHPPDEPAPARAPAANSARAPRCGDEERQRMKSELVARYRAAWEEAIKEECRADARRYAQHGDASPVAKVSKPITYEVEFSEACEPVRVRAAYSWRITWQDVGSLFGWCSKKMDASKTFACRKDEDVWRCG